LATCSKCGKEFTGDASAHVCRDEHGAKEERDFYLSKGVQLPPYWDELSSPQKETWVQYDNEQRASFEKWFLSRNQKSGIDAKIEEERKRVGFHSDEASKARYHSYLAIKGQVCEICKALPSPNLAEASGEVSFAKVQSTEPIENQPNFDLTDNVIVPGASRIVKDVYGRYVAQTTFTLRKREKEQPGENKTFVFNLGDLVFRIYKRKNVQDGKLAFVSQVRGKNISKFPMDFRTSDAQRLLAMCIYLLNRESSQKKHSGAELSARYVVPKKVAETYRELFLQEELGLKYTSQVESALKKLEDVNRAYVEQMIEEEIAIDAAEEERMSPLSDEELEAELRELEGQDKIVDEMIKDEGRKQESQGDS
jgi:hypothetical protein